MKIKPCLFVRGLNKDSLQSFKDLKAYRLPLVLLAKDLQSLPEVDRIMPELESDFVHIISNDVDEKKNDFQVALESSVAAGFTHMLVVDCENSEAVGKVGEMLKSCFAHPWKLIALSNEMETGKKETHWMKQAFVGSSNYSSIMTPQVCYPLFFIQTMSFGQNDPYPFLKVLCRLMWNKVEVETISIKNKYEISKKSYREKLYWTHYETLLTTIANIRQNKRPKNAAISCAVGAFIACTPFYGLQTLGIFIACFIFRLNFPIAFLGSQVSVPPLFSLILPLELYVGFTILDKPLIQSDDWIQTAQNHFSSWLLGAVVVGGVIAFIIGFAWYYLQTKMQTEKKVNWTGKMRGGKVGNYFVVAILKTLGQRAGYFLLYFIIPYFYLFAPKARRGLNEYWKVIHPEYSWWNRQKQVLKQLQCFAQIIMDRSIQAQKPKLDYNVDISQSIDFVAATESEQSLLVLLSHLGGWGIALQGFGKKTYSQPISIIEYENQSHSTEKGIQNKQLELVKRIIVKPGEPLFMHLHDLLNKGGNLGLMGDRPFDENYELLPFFGKLVAIPTTPLRLCKIYKCQLVVLLGLKTGFKDYELIAQVFETDKEIEQIAEDYLLFLEKHLRRYPHQWFNFFNFWSNQPTLPNGTVCQPKKYSWHTIPQWPEVESSDQSSSLR